jgi:hypothetical protein
MDLQIAGLFGDINHLADRYEDLVRPTPDDYAGLHVHCARWNPAIGRWVKDDDPTAWLEHLRVALGAYSSRFGTPPARHRFTTVPGLTNKMLETLATAKVLVDLSDEPRPRRNPMARTPDGVSFANPDMPLTIIRGTATRTYPGRGSLLRKAARRIRYPRSRWYLSPYRIIEPRTYWDLVTSAIERMPLAVRYVSLAMRTNAEGSPADQRQGELLRHFSRHPISRMVYFADPLEYALAHAGRPVENTRRNKVGPSW